MSLSANMNRTQRILQQLGIDIFTDLRYDTWVIQTIWGRIINNRGTKTRPGGRQICSIGSLWCLYHHGCQPNAAIAPLETPAGNDTLTRAAVAIPFTTRPSEKGKETLISHANHAGQNRATRQRSLRGRLPESCRCTQFERGESGMV